MQPFATTPLKLAVFDFDGTLANSVELCLTTFDQVFAHFLGPAAPSRETILSHFGRNELGIFRMFLKEKADAAEVMLEQLHQKQHPQFCPDVFPGIRELLRELKGEGLFLAVLTGRGKTTCHISLDYLKLTPYFDAFRYGSPDRSDKSLQMKDLMETFHVSPEEMIYVGDAVSDAESSFRAGVCCFSAAWAPSACRENLERINPGKVFASVEALKAALKSRIR